MAKKKVLLKAVAIVGIVGVPALLFLGGVYDILSDREWALGSLTWFATLNLWAVVGKLTTKKTPANSAESAVVIDDRMRKRRLRSIRMSKIWIETLAVLFPIGIVNCLLHREWGPMLSGGGISLLMMYVARENIRRLQRSLL